MDTDPYYLEEDVPLKIEEGYPEYLLGPLMRESWYDTRNNMAFGVLAGIGRYANDIVPISAARGLPDDVSEEARAVLLFWQCHDMSWLTLRELSNYNWKAKAPASFHQSFSTIGEDGKEVRHKELQKIYSSTGTLEDEMGEICMELVGRLSGVGQPDEVRIVFGFSS
ncbi:hypothetical protein [uncultured Deinococcus sp.]|uniref:hypothetical protein n=1 Tax=uncultured Deinococcus sp. TaxID=158789 RepID=UPI0025D5C0F6|nr:hypothetical protein [uncultured Deinococcus sp.]